MMQMHVCTYLMSMSCLIYISYNMRRFINYSYIRDKLCMYAIEMVAVAIHNRESQNLHENDSIQLIDGQGQFVCPVKL